ncbi:MAG: GxxExxY protein [Candidatus Berkelbacteria bacterium]
MTDIIFKEECYKIVGCCFDVFNDLGAGHREKTYQTALEKVFRTRKINFKSQAHFPLKVANNKVSDYFLDFLIDEKIAVEIKSQDHIHRKDIEQLFGYLRAANIKLGIIVNFTSSEVIYKRILNLK